MRTDVDFVGNASDGLDSSAVYVDPGSTLSSDSAIASLAADEHVGVVVLPDLATQTYSATGLATQLLHRTDGYEAIIVVVDGSSTSFGVAADDADEAVTLATELNSSTAGDAGAVVLETLQRDDWQGSVIARGSNDDGGGTLGTVVGVGGGLVGLAVVAAGAVLVARQLRRTGASGATVRDIPEELRQVLLGLDTLASQHGTSFSPGVSARLGSIRTNVRELFKRIKRTGTEQQVRIASIEYVDVLTKLNRALGPDYYLDILRNPRLWENPDGRRAEVEEAVAATDEQLVANIRQVNASQDLEFKVALESLVGSMNATVKDIYAKPDPTTAPDDSQGDQKS